MRSTPLCACSLVCCSHQSSSSVIIYDVILSPDTQRRFVSDFHERIVLRAAMTKEDEGIKYQTCEFHIDYYHGSRWFPSCKWSSANPHICWKIGLK